MPTTVLARAGQQFEMGSDFEASGRDKYLLKFDIM
jgi:hypothetical protein